MLLALDLESGPAFVTSVQVAREPVISVISANAYSDIVVSGLGALGTRLVQREELAVEGFEAVRAVLETPASGQTIRQLIYFIKTEQNVVWFVVFSSAREEFERRLPTFELSVRMLVVRDVHVGTLIVPAEPAVAASDTTSPGEPATALPTAAAEGFSANEIFERVSPSIVFITTLTSGGSGILIDETHVLTNAHVVWPHQEAEVLVPQGTPLLGRVVGWDLMADIAVLEVPRVSLGMTTPLTIVDGTNLPIGSELFLIGYPAEFERSPSPTISRGVLSRVRSWEPLGISFLQTDAAIASGQSGGALVSASGEVVGLSGRRLGEGNFALATSMPDVMSRVGRLLQGENVDGLGDRRYSMDGAGNEIQFTLPNLFFEQALLLNQPIGTRVMLELEGDHNGYFVAGLAGVPPIFWSIFADDTLTGLEEGELTTEFDAPHLVAAGQSDANSGEFVIRSNVPYPSPSLMIPMTDAKCPWARRSQRISIT